MNHRAVVLTSVAPKAWWCLVFHSVPYGLPLVPSNYHLCEASHDTMERKILSVILVLVQVKSSIPLAGNSIFGMPGASYAVLQWTAQPHSSRSARACQNPTSWLVVDFV